MINLTKFNFYPRLNNQTTLLEILKLLKREIRLNVGIDPSDKNVLNMPLTNFYRYGIKGGLFSPYGQKIFSSIYIRENSFAGPKKPKIFITPTLNMEVYFQIAYLGLEYVVKVI